MRPDGRPLASRIGPLCFTRPSCVSKAEVQPVEERVAALELGDDAQALRIVVEALIGRERLVERPLAGMAERRVAEVVRERQRLRQVLVEPERAGDRAGDLRHLQRMGQPGAEMVALVADEDLRLVLQPAEGVGMDDAVAVALEGRAERIVRLGVDAAARSGRVGGIGGAPALAVAQELVAAAPPSALPAIP